MSDELVPDPRQMRASDADREKVAQVLQRAHGEGRLDLHELDERLGAVYAAKTYGDLVPLTADLGVPAPAVLPMPVQHNAPASRIGGTPGSTASFAFWSGVERRGEWVVPPAHTAVAVMGGVELDLTKARFAQGQTTINAYAFMGAVEIIVPEDITVQVDGFGFMGAFEDATHKGAPTIPGGPVVRITGFAMMGAVEVKRPKKKKLKNRQRDELEG
ncbi:hypothetical protein ALI22I_35725 [Saccharothrix sp. ALI-22-I]|uniref:DUF1707 SHOCT-like domain-containing protein n=1 Tax=Saccharothrix sp. ALI-22-I TaxID=1933778 RepID=UPI00097C9B56|nr:DUF1707 domain-containing protein [Saccharothrix sp. ALI-22-I]ONI83798.1 hypothetical protein ALI22I_35725 [Saccharothrix sp. ALI-22-I]